MSRTLEWIGNLEGELREYPDSWLETEGRPRPCICWKDGSTLGMGWAAHMTGDPGGFKSMGFKGYDDFYRLPKSARNRFLKEAHGLFMEILGRDMVIRARRAAGTAKEYGTFGIKGRVQHYKEKEIYATVDELRKQLDRLAKKYKKQNKPGLLEKRCRDCRKKFRTEKNGIKTTVCCRCSEKRRQEQFEEVLGF